MSAFRPPKFVKKHDLQRMLLRLGCEIDLRRGAGSHWCVFRAVSEGRLMFALPDRREYGRDYIGPLRRRLRLTPGDGVSDEQFYDA